MIQLLRHGKTAIPWFEEPDAPLSELGKRQAAQVASRRSSPLKIVTSPMLRACETAAAFERRWKVCAKVDPRWGDIPAPNGPPTQRRAWLECILSGRWEDIETPEIHDWRVRTIEAIAELSEETLVVTHFLTINSAVAFARGLEQTVCVDVGNCETIILERFDTEAALRDSGR